MNKNLVKFLGLIILTCCSFSINAQNVNKALELFLNNKTNEAEIALLNIANDNANKEQAKACIALALIYKLNENDEEKVKYYVKGISNLENPDAYSYTLWGDCYFYNYPSYAQNIIKTFDSKAKVHPDILSALTSLKRTLFERNHQADSIQALNKKMGYVSQWELLGTFDYGDGYGFKFDENTVAHPENTYTFEGKNNSKVNWFPLIENVDMNRFYLYDFLDMSSSSTTKAYMQTFIKSDKEQDVIFNIICGSDIRAWVNDAVVYENRKNIEHISSLPFHLPVHLKQGVNRVLIQLGKKNEYSANFELYCTDDSYKALNSIQAQLKERTYTKETNPSKVVIDPNIESFNVQVFTEYLKEHPNDLLEQILRIEELNSTGDQSKTMNVVNPMHIKYPNSYYISNLYYNNKPNVSYSSKDDYLNHNCELCFSTLVQKYDEAINDGNKTKAKEALVKLESNFPNNYSVLLKKISNLIDENEYAEASALIETSLKKYDNKIALYNYKSSLLIAQGKKEENYNFLKSIYPNFNSTFVEDRLKDYVIEKNDTTEWMKITRNQMSYDKTDEFPISMVNMFNGSKKYDSSVAIFNQLVIQKPYSATIWEKFGDVELDRSNKVKALEYFNKSLTLYPQDYELIKKIKTNSGEKVEIEQIAPQNLKELYASKNISKISIPSKFNSRNWVALYKKQASVTYNGGLYKTKVYNFYKILTEAGIKDFKELQGGGSESELLIFKENGEIGLPEGSGTWVLPDLKVGDIIGIKYESDVRAYGYKSTMYQNVISLDENDPIIIFESEHLVSKKLGTEPKLIGNATDFKVDKKEFNKEFNSYIITAQKPLFIDPELHMNDIVVNNTFLSINNYKSWDEVAKWYWDIASPKLAENDTIKNIVSNLLDSKKNLNEFDKAQILYKWLETNINYSSQSFRQDNYVPQLPSKVVADKLGDCKDVAALYLLMCKEAGIKGNFVLVNMESRAALYKLFPNIAFNHCIAKIYPDGKPYYIELTSKSLPFATNLNYSGYAFGLEIDPNRTCDIAKIENEGRGDFFTMKSIAKVDEGKLNIQGKIAFLGITSSLFKDAFEKVDSTQIITALQKLLSDLMPSSNVVSSWYNAKQKNNDSIVVDFDLNNSDLYLDVADLEIYKIPTYLNKLIEESVFANTTRQTDMSLLQVLGYLQTINNEMSILVPKGKTLYKKPNSNMVSNKYFDFSVDVTETSNSIVVSRKFKAKTSIIPVSDFNDFKTEINKAFKADIVTLVFQ